MISFDIFKEPLINSKVPLAYRPKHISAVLRLLQGTTAIRFAM